jgi:hypothetical protein
MEAIVAATYHKTDSAGRPKILLPGSWNSVGQTKLKAEGALRSRFSFEGFQSEIAGTEQGSQRNSAS